MPNNNLQLVVKHEQPLLDGLEQEFTSLYAAFCGLARRTVEAAWQLGGILTEIKSLLHHGAWLPWLEKQGVEPRTAQRFLGLHNAYPEIRQLVVFENVDSALKALAPAHGARTGNGLHNGDDEWFTPHTVVEPCREALGGIDLDPASNAHANQVVKATRYFTVEDDGLEQSWKGRVFLNPPYSPNAGKAEFIAKLAESYSAGEVTAACAILSNDASASWFDPLRGRHAALCLIRGRVQFYKPNTDLTDSPGSGSSIVYLGPDVARFAKAVSALGEVYVPYRRP